ncbi:MAG: S26 family signal peptidase [Bacteroidales bacterium]|nr:S26 family signal peptidase [Bacteroidales bacterium]
MNILKNKYFKFGIAAILYILFVIWVGSYWLLFGLAVVFDIYVTEKVNWTFWKKRNEKNSVFIEWLDALIFAVIAVTLINIFFFQNFRIPTGSMEKSLLIGDHLFVSKLSYGPRIPNTPLSFPFTQHTLPIIRTKSFLEWIHWPYKRLAGFHKIKNNDIVVFNFPAGDTVVFENQVQSYYSIVRSRASSLRETEKNQHDSTINDNYYWNRARQLVNDNNTIVYRPVDKRDNYIKRCVGIPGDVLEIKKGKLFINGKEHGPFEHQQFNYQVNTSSRINPKAFDRLDIATADRHSFYANLYILPLTKDKVSKLEKFKNVNSIQEILREPGEYADYIFPHDPVYPWNEDNFGPLTIPAKGVTVKLTPETLPLYERIIDTYEDNDLKVTKDQILINGDPASEYTFKMDYYWMMGDNRHNSADSRFWGFVPEDHVVGRPIIIWLSLDKDKKFLSKIRWNRFFKTIR